MINDIQLLKTIQNRLRTKIAIKIQKLGYEDKLSDPVFRNDIIEFKGKLKNEEKEKLKSELGVSIIVKKK
ncbi:MAG: hypothetical protein LBU40_04990 [Methanobrevibacter sp.]|jgi:hypothetical protein|nr:hypothetical protein [Methanobrevibacter sp.]